MRSGVTPGCFSTGAQVDAGETMAEEFEGAQGGDPVRASQDPASASSASSAGPGSSP